MFKAIARVVLAATLAAGAASSALAQAAVQSDTPVPSRDPAAAGLGAAIPHGDATSPRDPAFPDPATAPGSPGTTGTGAAGTGPSNTMAAPGR